MMRSVKLVIWNANGLGQHSNELKAFLINQNIDIMLISETHFTKRSYFRIPNYTIYNAYHPSGNARGGAAIIIRNKIEHNLSSTLEKPHLQAVAISIRDGRGPLTIAAIYCPPNNAIKSQNFNDFFNTLGSPFLTGGDFNAKHTHWGSRLISPRGRELMKSIDDCNLSHLSTGEPTYWPADRSKTPDVIDFCVFKGIPKKHLTMCSSLELSSDHSPLIMEVNSNVIEVAKEPHLCNKYTDWVQFRHFISDHLDSNSPLKTATDIETAVEHFNTLVQKAAWSSTPHMTANNSKAIDCNVEEQLRKKRKLRRIWQITRNPEDKRRLNAAIRKLKETFQANKDKGLETYLSNLSPCEATDYSLWKATRHLNGPTQRMPPIKMNNGHWARTNIEKANTFAAHLRNVFQPYASTDLAHDAEIEQFLQTPHQMDHPIQKFSASEVRWTIKNKINARKAPGYDLITGKVLKELPNVAIKFITQLFNAVINREYYPRQWKVAQIILILKPGKPAELATSYRPISLLPVLSKVFERVFLKRLNKVIKNRSLIPTHQFGFRTQHSTVEQINRVYQYARDALERKEYCTAAFLDITQAFDKVWHTGLLYKLKIQLPHSHFSVLRSYILDRSFMVKVVNNVTDLFPIEAGVPQGSVLGPTLYTLFTADLPLSRDTHTATFADDTVIMARSNSAATASQRLQTNLNVVNKWLNTWRFKTNESKSTQTTFTLRHGECPPVMLNNCLLSHSDHTKYLGIHFDRRLTWQHHIFTKRKQLGLKLRSLYWMICPKSKLSLTNKVLLYKAVIKPIWTYGIPIWGTASKSNLDILQRFQSKILRICTNAPWYVPNASIHRDLGISTVYETIQTTSRNYRSRLQIHPNPLASELVDNNSPARRLRRVVTADLPSRFQITQLQ